MSLSPGGLVLVLISVAGFISSPHNRRSGPHKLDLTMSQPCEKSSETIQWTPEISL